MRSAFPTRPNDKVLKATNVLCISRWTRQDQVFAPSPWIHPDAGEFEILNIECRRSEVLPPDRQGGALVRGGIVA